MFCYYVMAAKPHTIPTAWESTEYLGVTGFVLNVHLKALMIRQISLRAPAKDEIVTLKLPQGRCIHKDKYGSVCAMMLG